jgi:hypothetical protein
VANAKEHGHTLEAVWENDKKKKKGENPIHF